MAIEPDGDERAQARARRTPKRAKPIRPSRVEDAAPANQCPRCGYPGPHSTAAACIVDLRDRLSKFE